MRRELKRRSAIEATIGPHEERRPTGPQFPPRPCWRCDQCATRSRRPKSAPDPHGSRSLFCLVPAGTPAENGEIGCFHLSSSVRNINALAIIQGRLLGLQGCRGARHWFKQRLASSSPASSAPSVGRPRPRVSTWPVAASSNLQAKEPSVQPSGAASWLVWLGSPWRLLAGDDEAGLLRSTTPFALRRR